MKQTITWVTQNYWGQETLGQALGRVCELDCYGRDPRWYDLLAGNLALASLLGRAADKAAYHSFLAGLECGECGDLARYVSWEAAANAHVSGDPLR